MLHWFNRTALVTTDDTTKLDCIRQALAAAGIPYEFAVQNRDGRTTRDLVNNPMLSVRSATQYTIYVHRKDREAAQCAIRR